MQTIWGAGLRSRSALRDALFRAFPRTYLEARRAHAVQTLPRPALSFPHSLVARASERGGPNESSDSTVELSRSGVGTRHVGASRTVVNAEKAQIC